MINDIKNSGDDEFCKYYRDQIIVNFILPEMKNAKHGYSIFVVIICNQKDHMNEETHEFLEFTETINNILLYYHKNFWLDSYF